MGLVEKAAGEVKEVTWCWDLLEEKEAAMRRPKKSISGRGHSRCKGPEVGRSLQCLRPQRRLVWGELQGQDEAELGTLRGLSGCF